MQVFVLLFINMGLLSFSFFCIKKKTSPLRWTEIVKHVVILEIAWGIFSMMFGLFILFNALESVSKNVSFAKTAGASNLMLLTISLGFAVFHFFVSSILLYKIFRTASN